MHLPLKRDMGNQKIILSVVIWDFPRSPPHGDILNSHGKNASPSLNLSTDLRDVDDFVSAVQEGLHVTELVELEIYIGTRRLSRKECHSIFKPARGIQRVKFETVLTSSYFMNALLKTTEYLQDNDGYTDHESRTPDLSPNLKILIIGDIDVAAFEDKVESFELVSEDILFGLLDILHLRAEIGAPIKHPELPERLEGEFDSGWVMALEDLVVDHCVKYSR